MKRMSKFVNRLVGVALFVAASLAPTLSQAQRPNDFPGLKGFGDRAGRNQNPLQYGPQRSYLTWFAPRGFKGASIQVDDTDISYDGLEGGVVQVEDASPGGISLAFSSDPVNYPWSPVMNSLDAASPYIRPYKFAKDTTQGLRPVYYHYCSSAPSHDNGDPTSGATASWTYRFLGPTATTTASIQTYALWVHLPIGPTKVAGVARYQQRYAVYKVRASGQEWTEIIDTQLAGGGWVRLGGGGGPSTKVYPYDGVNPIDVVLYNSVPRNYQVISGSTDHGLAGTPGQLVYADAAKIVPVSGTATSSPIAAALDPAGDVGGDPSKNTTSTAFQARNEYSVATAGGVHVVNQGVVTAYHTSNSDPAVGRPVWQFRPADSLSGTVVVDSSNFPSVTPGWTVNNTYPRYSGTNCLVMPAATSESDFANCYRATATQDASYAVYVYSPGDDAATGRKLAKHMNWFVRVKGVWTSYEVDMSVAGWRQVGTGRYDDLVTSTLQVAGTNLCTAADVADGREVYVNAVKFTTDANLTIQSTPFFASNAMINVAGTPTAKNIVIVGDETGRLHCLDANGNGDGTTTEYWTYPSTPDPNNSAWTDPNAVAGQDGVGRIADLPSAFNLSSAAVTTLASGQSVLYIGGTNGRVYCIDVTGRGDFNATTHLPGTTSRVWTYPATYPSANQVTTSALGAFSGSIVVGPGPATGQPYVYVPAAQGRMYCLDGTGLPADKSTNVVWAFPSMNRQTLGALSGTPALATIGSTNYLYFGTEIASNVPRAGDEFVEGAGGFYCLNAATGAIQWRRHRNQNSTRIFDNFISGPAYASYVELGDNVTPGGIVYAINDDNFIYAFDALQGGVPASGIVWESDELLGVATGGLSFASLQVLQNTINAGTGTVDSAESPTLLVPLADGRFSGLFAKPATTNRFGTRRDWQYNPQGRVTANLAIANGFMFGADEDGYAYAFSDKKGAFGPDEFVPGEEFIVENDLTGDIFRKAKIKFITPDAYRVLEDDASGTAGNRTYPYVTSAATASTRNPAAFEWGEMLYAVVYDFPFLTQNSKGTTITPGTIDFQIALPGGTTQPVTAEMRRLGTVTGAPLFKDAVTQAAGSPPPALSYIPYPFCAFDGDSATWAAADIATPWNAPNRNSFPQNSNYAAMDGYALLAFRIQGTGQNGLLPGPATITYTVKSPALNSNGNEQAVAPNPLDGFGRKQFFVANPLGLAMALDASGIPVDDQSIGNVVDPANPQATMNGSRDVPSTTKVESHLLTSAGIASHGNSQSSSFWVFDRSFMSLIRPNDATSKNPSGLDFVRVHRNDLGRQGGAGTVRKPFDPILYPNFEDLPVNFPNTSIDYPNLRQDYVSFTKDPNGTAENPVFSGVALAAPMVLEGGVLRPLKETDDPLTRILRPTEFKYNVDVPRFFPANTMVDDAGNVSPDVFLDSANQVKSQGYRGRFDVFVDSDQTGRFGGSVRRAFRSFSLALSVAFDERLAVTTPQVDLGSLPGGAGLTGPGATPAGTASENGAASVWSANFGLNPWSSAYSNQFQSFNVQNIGNVNLLNLRLAKADATQASSVPWYLTSPQSDALAWFDSTVDLWSDLDQAFHPDPTKNVVLQKPRVGDVAGTNLNVNPVRRANSLLGVTSTFTSGGVTYPNVLVQTLKPGGGLLFPPAPPKVGVTVPIGFPVGQYGQVMRVIEKQDGRQNSFWEWINAGKEAESASDPTFTLLFNARETRLTNRNTAKSGIMTDNSLDANWPNNPSFAGGGLTNNPFAYQNMQPGAMRDAYGSLVVAWATDRPSNATLRAGEASITPQSVNTDGRFRINVASLANGSTFTPSGFSTPIAPATAQSSPIRDLDFWKPNSNAQWFNQGVSNYPSGSAPTIFGAGAIDGTENFGSPVFPNTGEFNPFDHSVVYQAVQMAFVGNVQRSTASGRQNESYIGVATVTPSSTGALSISNPSMLTSDPFSAKGRPSIVQTSTGAMVFYPSLPGGKKSINYARLNNGNFGPASALDFGGAFSSVDTPNAMGRAYVGANVALRGGVIELTFAGRVAGRPSAEIYSGRLAADKASSLGAVDRLPEAADGTLPSTPWIAQAGSYERLTPDAIGTYRARGVYMDPTSRIQLFLVRQGQAPINPILDGYDNLGVYTAANDTRRYDSSTGLISFQCRLGGLVYIDPKTGTVRFSSAIIDRTSEIRATYVARFMRISSGAQGALTQPTALFDERPISNINLWMTANNAVLTGAMTAFNHRMVYTYNRSAVGTGQAARPLMTTFRLGVKLPYPVATINGVPAIAITGGINGPYQVDAANGRVYFETIDEDNSNALTVNYTGLTNVGQQIPVSVKVGPIAWIPERAEELLPIEQAANESGLTSFLDPFAFLNQRRPPLMWMFWTSSRAGVPDIYFQSVAPQFSPVP